MTTERNIGEAARRDGLGSIEPFDRLPSTTLLQLDGIGRPRRYCSGSTIMKAGEIPDFILILPTRFGSIEDLVHERRDRLAVRIPIARGTLANLLGARPVSISQGTACPGRCGSHRHPDAERDPNPRLSGPLHRVGGGGKADASLARSADPGFPRRGPLDEGPVAVGVGTAGAG